MRPRLLFPFATVVATSLIVACSSSSSSGDTPTFTAADVKPTIEGTWKGVLVKGTESAQGTLKLTYAPASTNVKTACSNRTLSEGSDLAPRCIDVSTLPLAGTLTLESVSTPLSGSMMVMELTYRGRGDVSLQDSSNNRVNAQLESGKLTGTATLSSGTYDFVLTR